jgi:hypothetical protein
LVAVIEFATDRFETVRPLLEAVRAPAALPMVRPLMFSTKLVELDDPKLMAVQFAACQLLLAVLLPIQNEPIVEIEIVFAAVIEAADIPVTVIEPVTAKLEWLAEEHVIPPLEMLRAPAALPTVIPRGPTTKLVELDDPKRRPV